VAASILPQDVIRRKRDGDELTEDQIGAFIEGATSGSISEGQIGAFLMAVYLNGMTSRETVALALAMRDSGTILDWRPHGLDDRRLVEKHSSGGVGDEKITLIVAPLAAACGVNAPNISARGLDFTAGEVDLLDSIQGYQTSPGAERFQGVVRDVGCAIIGPTPDLAPADRRLYYVRDVTATVESVALITSSIMSKKLASGANGYVFCVGSGSGAFMPTLDDARALATAMADVASGAGVPSVMLLTDLDPVLGTSVGNALAVAEAIDVLSGRAADPRVLELVLAVTAEMVVMAGLAGHIGVARSLVEARLADGSGADRFARMVAALGGPPDILDPGAGHLPVAPVIRAVEPRHDGFVSGMDARAIGQALVAIGGGRTRPDDEIDLAVGVTRVAGIGEAVGSDRPLCLVHARDEAGASLATERIRAAFRIGEEPATPGPIVLARLERRP
jgi:thymidine phosphorylase